MEIKDAVIDFGSIPYERKLPERALYPFSQLNYLTGGMELGEITVIAGETGSGKTTFVSQVVDNIIKDDKVFCVYGESTIQKQQQNTYRQMAGYGKEKYEYVSYKKNGKDTNIGAYFVNEEIERQIRNKTSKKLFYYDTRYGMTIDKILEVIKFCHENERGKINYFVLDNLMQIETTTADEIREQKDCFEKLRRYTTENNIHIVVLAHYRKSADIGVIRRNLSEIAGTSAIGNKSATALNIMRLDNVDKSGKAYKSLKAVVKLNNYDLDQADAVIEVLKNRFNKLGFICLKYDRISNTYYECPKLDEEKKESEKSVVYETKQTSIDLMPMTELSEKEQQEIDDIFGDF